MGWNETIQEQNAISVYKNAIKKVTGQEINAEKHCSPEDCVYAFSLDREGRDRKARREVETKIHREVENVDSAYVGMVGVIWNTQIMT